MNGIVLRLAEQADIAAMSALSAKARLRYRDLPSLSYVADMPAVDEDRFRSGQSIIAAMRDEIVGFALITPMDGLLILDNISTSAKLGVCGIGKILLEAVIEYAGGKACPAVALTTFRDPPWNGPWFRKFGFAAMPEDRIGPELRSVIARQALYLDPSTRETLWRPFSGF